MEGKIYIARHTRAYTVRDFPLPTLAAGRDDDIRQIETDARPLLPTYVVFSFSTISRPIVATTVGTHTRTSLDTCRRCEQTTVLLAAGQVRDMYLHACACSNNTLVFLVCTTKLAVSVAQMRMSSASIEENLERYVVMELASP
jgi:hypothetical protein